MSNANSGNGLWSKLVKLVSGSVATKAPFAAKCGPMWNAPCTRKMPPVR